MIHKCAPFEQIKSGGNEKKTNPSLLRAGRVWRSSRKIKNTSRKGKLTFTSKNILIVWCLWLNKSLLMSISYAHLRSLWVLGNVYSQLIAFNLHRNICMWFCHRKENTQSKRIHKGYWYWHQDWITTEHFINLTFFPNKLYKAEYSIYALPFRNGK